MLESQRDQPRISEQPLDDGSQRSELDFLTRLQRRWQRTILRARAVISRSKYDRTETQHVLGRERSACRESHFDFRARLHVHATEACWQGGRVVRDDDVIRPEQIDQRAARHTADATRRIHVQEPRLG
jgi:hypothetical protein